ncbi:MAG: DnaJ domain-containing protein [Candidatus Schekmanbacteria bacterium]|nr:DnaJ domain-containing protein [Candidatus Schekmanbacteria bacterium]
MADQEMGAREALALKIRFQGMDYYERLGVSRKADNEEIAQAYLKKVRELHPDRHFHQREVAVGRELEEVLMLLNEARHVLSDRVRRHEYDRKHQYALNTGTPTPVRSAVDETARKKTLADSHYEQAVQSLQRGDGAGAVTSLRSAVTLVPGELKFRLLLSEALIVVGNLHDARNETSQIIQAAPKDARAFYLMGLIYEKANLPKNAVREYKKAIELDPTLLAAQKRLQALPTDDSERGDRSSTSIKVGGLLQKLRGRRS